MRSHLTRGIIETIVSSKVDVAVVRRPSCIQLAAGIHILVGCVGGIKHGVKGS
jgi:hypothetical protein